MSIGIHKKYFKFCIELTAHFVATFLQKLCRMTQQDVDDTGWQNEKVSQLQSDVIELLIQSAHCLL
jgi:hypothetical protein